MVVFLNPVFLKTGSRNLTNFTRIGYGGREVGLGQLKAKIIKPGLFTFNEQLSNF